MQGLKNLVLLLVCCFCIPSVSYTQLVSNTTTVQVVLPNIANKALFVESPRINSLLIEYRNGKQVSLAIYYQSPEKQVYNFDEFYDLTFAGDQYLLAKKYGSSGFLNYPQVGLINETITVRPVQHQYSIKEFVNIDSLKYEITVKPTSKGNADLYYPVRTTARYRGGNEKLTSDIIQYSNLIQINTTDLADTVLLYRGMVDRDGSLSDVERTLGTLSGLSHDIQRGIERTSGYWQPELQGGRPVKSLVDIFVRINRNREISASFSGLNRR